MLLPQQRPQTGIGFAILSGSPMPSGVDCADFLRKLVPGAAIEPARRFRDAGF